MSAEFCHSGTVERQLLFASLSAKDAGLTEEQFLEWARAYYRRPAISEEELGEVPFLK